MVAGASVDTVERVGTGVIIDALSGMLPSSREINRALNEVNCIISDISSYPTGESLFKVKWRTFNWE